MTVLNAISIDVEDYFQTEAMSRSLSRDDWESVPWRVERNTHRLLEAFSKAGARGTFFFLGWVAERMPKLVETVARAGHEVGCHSYWHRPIFRLDADEFRSDTLRAKHAIEDAAGAPVLGYRAPSFSLTPGTEWAAEILAELGFQYDSSVNPIHHDTYSNASAPRVPHRIAGGALAELPIATVRVGTQNLPIGGGAYLRIFPYRYMAWGLRKLNQVEGRAGMIYLHPWEIDPEQPRLRAGARSSLRQYTGLAGTLGKLERLLREFRFDSVENAFHQEIAQRRALEMQHEAAVA